MAARFAPVSLAVDTSGLDAGSRAALDKLRAAAHEIDELYWEQMWAGNWEMREKLRRDASPLGRLRLRYFEINKGPWSALDDHAAFLPDAPERKPLGANFYPEDMTRDEFERWAAGLSDRERAVATGFFSVIRRDGETLRGVPYSSAYAVRLERIAGLLREAAALCGNASLARFLDLRAKALLDDDYYASDVAWLDVDAPIDVTIGPYETYTDELFGYKAAFEAYIGLRDDAETARLAFFANHLQEIENNLPVAARHRNPKLAPAAPIRVIHEILASGDAAHGVRTAAFNLPNDERVVREKGAKRVMLKNVQEAKFRVILQPVAERVLAPAARADVRFDAFFTHILAHELSHGIGPQTLPGGTPRQALKELYGAIEEAKADITALYMLQYLFDHHPDALPSGPAAERQLYTTFLASSFRTLRFGIGEAHGRGMAVQLNYLTDQGAVTARPDGTFAIDFVKIKTAVRNLTRELLTIEATGDYEGAKALLDRLAVIRPPVRDALSRLAGLPTDIEPRR
ncbi:MAG: hypothetical protein IPM24_07740 [Bryobacterales bacterium]|nr:hypothetical protein [Bryobacterales bacterium]